MHRSHRMWIPFLLVLVAQSLLLADVELPNVFGEARTCADSSGTVAAEPETVRDFSAVAFFYGRELRRELDVPVPWTPPIGFASIPELHEIDEQIRQAQADYREQLGRTLEGIEVWLRDSRNALAANGPLEPMPATTHPLGNSRAPTSLYNGMVHPLASFAIRGAIWYQGESNVGDGSAYLDKMRALIGGWRSRWGQGDFPFYFVQLAPIDYTNFFEVDPFALPLIWEAQTGALSLANTGMVVTTDIGDTKDIHPSNKQDIGKRLARWALARTYGRQDLVYSGPLYRSMEVEGSRVRIHFDHTGSGLTSSDGKRLTRFEIAGDDQRFVAARATVDGDTIVVANDEVSDPVAVRFGWHQEAEPNLSNREGLPASPFRTDRW
jgi:sialate O-acetylesterase